MYPIQYEADYERNPNRLTTFFRPIIVIPWLIVAAIYAIGFVVTLLIAFIALVILGRYPEGLYNLNSGFLRYFVRVYGFLSLLTDQLPPFGLADDPSYPIRLNVPPPPEKQSRLKVFFRFILQIPLSIVGYFIGLVHNFSVVANWLTIVFRGYTPAGLYNALYFSSAFNARYSVYMVYLTDDYPPVGDDPDAPGDHSLQAAAAAPTIGGQATATPAAPPVDPGQPPAGS